MTVYTKPGLLPGMFGLSVIGGKVGRLVAAGQALTGDGSRYTHAFMIVDNDEIVEAMPDGARIYPLAKRVDDVGGIVITDAPVQSALHTFDYYYSDRPEWRQVYEDNLRAAIVAEARGLEGTPYNFPDYFYLALCHFGLRAKWLERRINDSGKLICSQLVDEVYRRCGIHLFNDGRLAQDVTPGDLDYYRISNEFGVL